jgi:hypothetical protein
MNRQEVEANLLIKERFAFGILLLALSCPAGFASRVDKNNGH